MIQITHEVFLRSNQDEIHMLKSDFPSADMAYLNLFIEKKNVECLYWSMHLATVSWFSGIPLKKKD